MTVELTSIEFGTLPSAIASAPKDRPILLYYEKSGNGAVVSGWIEGEWVEQDEGWETIIGTIGEPIGWCELPSTPPVSP